MTEPSPRAGTITLEQVARLLMISRERVRQLVAAGYIPKPNRNAYPIVGAVQGYIRAKEDELRRARDAAGENGLRSARQAEIEMRMAERRRDLVRRDEADAAMDIVVGQINEEFGGFAARVTRDVAMRRQIETALDATLNRIADKCSSAKAELSEGGRSRR